MMSQILQSIWATWPLSPGCLCAGLWQVSCLPDHLSGTHLEKKTFQSPESSHWNWLSSLPEGYLSYFLFYPLLTYNFIANPKNSLGLAKKGFFGTIILLWTSNRLHQPFSLPANFRLNSFRLVLSLDLSWASHNSYILSLDLWDFCYISAPDSQQAIRWRRRPDYNPWSQLPPMLKSWFEKKTLCEVNHLAAYYVAKKCLRGLLKEEEELLS